MTKYLLLLLFSCSFVFLQAQSSPRCGATELRAKNALLHPEYAHLPSHTPENMLIQRDIITIPIVVHVVWKEEEHNISEEQIASQFQVLADDFTGLNDVSNVPNNWTDLIANTEIHFCLAARDAEGNPTSGIIRRQTDVNLIGLKEDLYYDFEGGSTAWDASKFINIWIADMGNSINGMATFPGSVPPEKDGIVIDPRYFGTTGLASEPPYNLGRTLTHELGHFLNLEHLWGQSGSGSCDEDDFVEDTPNCSASYLGECPNAVQLSCNSTDMYMNFMMYTDDACMSFFTEGQKERMHATLFGERSSLLDSHQYCVIASSQTPTKPNFSLQPNPAKGAFSITLTNNYQIEKVTIYTINGQKLKEWNNWQVDTSISTNNLPNGAYIIAIQQNDKQYFERLLVFN